MPNAGARILAADNARWICKAAQGTAQSIPNNAFTAITFAAADDVDNLGIHDPVTNNTRFNIGAALGWWWVVGKFTLAGSAAAQSRRARLLLNGNGINGSYSAFPSFTVTGGFWTLESSTLVQATASADYVELTGFQDSGGALSTTVSGDLRSQMLCIYQGA